VTIEAEPFRPRPIRPPSESTTPMRYPREKIQEAILDPDIETRERAVSYFALAFSRDLSIMPTVIQAIERYGRQNEATRLLQVSRRLLHTTETISWLIDELNAEQTDNCPIYADSLSIILAEADAVLLRPREADIFKARHFSQESRPKLASRLQMLEWDQAECWKELEIFCEDCQDEHSAYDVDLSYAKLVVEALARFGKDCEPTVLKWLSVAPDDPKFPLMRWLEPLVVSLTGHARLESTVPIVMGKLLEDTDDLLNEECIEALVRIGTPAVLHAIAEAFPTCKTDIRFLLTNPLSNIPCDLAVEIVLAQNEQETEELIRMDLAAALLRQFASEGIDLTRQLLAGRPMDFVGQGLRQDLLQNCKLTGERFPEYDAWLATQESEDAAHERWMNEWESDPDGMWMRAAREKAKQQLADQPPLAPPWESGEPITPRLSAPQQKIGRNERCPCGSGKKFKQCCLKK